MSKRTKDVRSYKDLDVFQRAMDLAMEPFEITKGFPTEERYSLTDQIRKSSQAVPANISEAWRKRRYPAAFVSKLSDAETEATETHVWIEFSRRCGYLGDKDATRLDDAYDHVVRQLVRMLVEPEKWAIKPG